MALYVGTPREIFERKHRQPLASAPGSRFVYSDAGYEVLGEIVRTVSGRPLDEFAAMRVFAPLGMSESEFRPGGKGKLPVSRIAPTEKIGDAFRRGEVHDPRAFALGGVAGHAGLFSTADDLARYVTAMLKGGVARALAGRRRGDDASPLVRRRGHPRARVGRGDVVRLEPG